MTARTSRLLPLLAVAAVLAGAALALAAVNGAAAGGEPASLAEDGAARDVAATCVEGAEDCADTIAPGAPDIAPMCVEGPAADCVDTVEPDDAIADGETGTDPCYDTGVAPGEPYPDDRCKVLADDLVACIADPDSPVSSDPVQGDVPAAPPQPGDVDGNVSEPYPGDGSPPDAGQLAEDIAAREECKLSGACD